VVEFTFIPGTRDPETRKASFAAALHFSLFPSNFLPFTLSSSSLPSPPFPFLLGDPLGLLCLTHYCLQVLTFLRSGLIRRLPRHSSFCVNPKIRGAATGLVCAIVVT